MDKIKYSHALRVETRYFVKDAAELDAQILSSMLLSSSVYFAKLFEIGWLLRVKIS
jgi:hypothetical protein